MQQNDTVWKSDAVVKLFLESVRGAIPFADTQIDILLRLVETRGESVQYFADLGCGNGILASALLARYPQARGILVDFSEPMLEQAREGLEEYTGQLAFENLDYGDPAWVSRMQAYGLFDAIVSGYSIHHQPDIRKREIYAEIYSLLKPNGWFVNIEHVSSAAQLNIDLFEHHYVSARYAIERQNGGARTCEQISDEYKNRPDKAANILAPVELQCDWLREIGYEEVDCYFRIYELAVFAGRRPA